MAGRTMASKDILALSLDPVTMVGYMAKGTGLQIELKIGLFIIPRYPDEPRIITGSFRRGRQESEPEEEVTMELKQGRETQQG